MSQNKSPTLSASSGLQLSCTLCPVTRAQELDEAPTILLWFAVTLYCFYMLWRKGLEESVVTFWKYLLGVGRQWRKSCILLVGSLLMICLSGRSQSLVLLWKHCTGVFGVSLLRLEQRRREVRNIWVSFQSWNYLSGWCIRVESTGSLGKHCIWVQLHITSSSTWLAREQELQECFW